MNSKLVGAVSIAIGVVAHVSMANAASWTIGGDSLAAAGTLGSTNAQSVQIKVNNSRAFLVAYSGGTPGIVGGNAGNAMTAGVLGSIIAGGGKTGAVNNVTDNYSFVGGGAGNQAGDNAGTVSDADYAFVGGGSGNAARADSAAIVGGIDNVADGYVSFVGGGYANAAQGDYSMVPGGYNSGASGNYSFAAGDSANANADHCFVWSDGSTTTACAASNTFVIRAHGGTTFYSGFSLGVTLAPNGGSFTSLSDRNAKRDIIPIDSQGVLRRFRALPIYTWKYKADPNGDAHMGPMAQDFRKSFGLGPDDDKHISTQDAEGVLFGSVHAVSEELLALQRDNAELRNENSAIKDRLDALERRAGRGSAWAPVQSSLGLTSLGLCIAGLVFARSRKETVKRDSNRSDS